MKDSDKIIVVFYIDVSNLHKTDVPAYMENVRYAFEFDNSVRPIFIPVEETSRVEVLNPRYIPKNEYKKIVKQFNEVLDNIKNTTDNMRNKNNIKKQNSEIEEHKHYFLVDGLKVHWNFKLLPKGFEAITLFGHIFDVKSKDELRTFLGTYTGVVMVNHERIHTLQGKSFKLGYFTFYLLYLWYWFIGLFKYGVKNNASYYHIPFEAEAYTNEQDFTYPCSEWKKYIGK
jgi:hypothetical protein